MSRRIPRVRTMLSVRRADVRAARWASAQLEAVRPKLRAVGVRADVPPPPEGLPYGAIRSVNKVLDLRSATCLERCMVLQSWLGAHGRPTPVVIGVGSRNNSFIAHAWLDGFDPPTAYAGFREIRRLDAVT